MEDKSHIVDVPANTKLVQTINTNNAYAVTYENKSELNSKLVMAKGVEEAVHRFYIKYPIIIIVSVELVAETDDIIF